MKWRWLCVGLVVILAAALLCCASLPADEEANASSMADYGLMLLDSDSGVSVLAVRDRSPADKAGIQPGDILTSANDTPFATIEQLDALLLEDADRTLRLKLQRGLDEWIVVHLILH